MARQWRLAKSLVTLRAECKFRWPGRDVGSDGTIGNAEHATRDSDHNPWVDDPANPKRGVVRAVDIDKDVDGNPDAPAPEDIHWLAEHLRRLGEYGDPRLNGGGYVIWNARIASEKGNWAWRPYSGKNAHKSHVHVSVSRNPSHFDSMAPWGIQSVAAEPGPRITPGPIIITEDPPMQPIRVDVPKLDKDGKGFITVNVPEERVVSLKPHGSFPPVDGYWTIPKLASQPRDGKTIVEITDGLPLERGRFSFTLWVTG